MLEDEKKEARLCEEWRSQHASERAVRGSERSTVDPITAGSITASRGRAVRKTAAKSRRFDGFEFIHFFVCLFHQVGVSVSRSFMLPEGRGIKPATADAGWGFHVY